MVAALDGIKLGLSNNAPVINLNIVVVIVSSIVAILTTGLKTFNYQDIWTS